MALAAFGASVTFVPLFRIAPTLLVEPAGLITSLESKN
jgi:hypothetical protein